MLRWTVLLCTLVLNSACDDSATKRREKAAAAAKPATTAPQEQALIPPAAPTQEPLSAQHINQKMRTLSKANDLQGAVAFASDPRVAELSGITRRSFATQLRQLAMRRSPEDLRTQDELALLKASTGVFSDDNAMGAIAESITRGLGRRRGRRPFSAEERRQARTQLDALTAMAPRAGFAFEFLATLADADDDYPGRLAYLERALEASPTNARLRQKVREAQVQLQMEGKFKRAKDAHFDVKFEGAAQERLAYTTLRLVEQAYFRVNSRLQFEPQEPVTVVIYTGNQYANALGLPDWSGGGFDGKIRVRAGDIRAQKGTLKSLLEHEYVHAALHAAAGFRIPVWFHEGVAQSLSSQTAATRTRDQAFLRGAYKRDLLFSYVGLSQSFTRIKNKATARLAYAQSAALVEEMQRTQGDQGIAKLLRKMRKGSEFDAAFKATFFKTPQAFVEDWARTLDDSR